MPTVSEIDAVTILLEIEGETSLFILLAEDGSINRRGTGTMEDAGGLFLGVIQEPLFSQLMANLNDEVLDHMGAYINDEPKGALCELTIGFSFRDADDNGFAFRYGSESEGPPGVIVQFVMSAIELTEPWYQETKSAVDQADE
mgnify:CR=1 FL=1